MILTQEEIVTGNKLIAEFMGYKYVHPSGDYSFELQYHSSWDWLMPVVKKIQESYQGEEHHIKSCELYSEIESMLKELKIEWVWQFVIKFIKWYNEIKK